MNYPGIKKEYKKEPISKGNRGMNLETLINETNAYYIEKDIAIIYKKPTPIGISKTTYQNGKPKIEGFFQNQSTLDYNGIYKGYYIDFDAKETTSKTAFPLSNVHPHQLEHMKRIIHHGGITFLLISMNSLYFVLDGKKLFQFIDSQDRKSIPFSYLVKEGIQVQVGFIPALDYKKALDELIKEIENENHKE